MVSRNRIVRAMLSAMLAAHRRNRIRRFASDKKSPQADKPVDDTKDVKRLR